MGNHENGTFNHPATMAFFEKVKGIKTPKKTEAGLNVHALKGDEVLRINRGYILAGLEVLADRQLVANEKINEISSSLLEMISANRVKVSIGDTASISFSTSQDERENSDETEHISPALLVDNMFYASLYNDIIPGFCTLVNIASQVNTFIQGKEPNFDINEAYEVELLLALLGESARNSENIYFKSLLTRFPQGLASLPAGLV